MTQSKSNQEAMRAFDAHGESAVPEAEQGDHSRSHAAHTETHEKPHTKRAGDLRKSVDPGELREPPQDLRRIGRSHRNS